MFAGKEDFLTEFKDSAAELFGKQLSYFTKTEIYEALARFISGKAALIRTDTLQRMIGGRKKEIYYFSMEFLIGRLLKNYLINLGVEDTVRGGLNQLGINLDELYSCERDPGLGNGGLGRLAACYMDSAAFSGIPCVGMGIRYRFGLFKQIIVDGCQTEEPDPWLDTVYPWETAKTDASVEVKFGGVVDKIYNGKLSFNYRDYKTVLAVPYDVPVVGYGGGHVNLLRLWRALPVCEEFDLKAFNNGDYSGAARSRNEVEALTAVLYPDDSSSSGRELRLRQEYFFVAAGIGSIMRNFRKRYGSGELKNFSDYVRIHINDTHPALCAPELMRILLDEEHMEWDEAWKITTSALTYTNHTIMPEALERWPIELMRRLLPRVYMIIEEIDRRYKEKADRSRPDWQESLKVTSILWDGQVNMANLSVICSHTVNGVSQIHSDILTKETLKEFYKLTPGKFCNVTNGVSHRRFLLESNPGLSHLITDTIGDGWISDASRLSDLLKFKCDSAFLDKLGQVKRENKLRLAEFIKKQNNIIVDPDSIFDIQVKRIHAYKRQLLFAFKIMNMYNTLKANPGLGIKPVTFIFAGKAAPGYVFAKEVIKFINTVAHTVNNDPNVNNRMKVVFIENFGVSIGQLIYPAADISEQISTAGKEASGTGNMKFMMNGAVTLGTADGANIEILELVGNENIFMFGLKANEVLHYYKSGGYISFDQYQSDKRLTQICDELISGFYKGHEFNGIYDSLLHNNDEYFVLKDFDSYIRTSGALEEAYNSPRRWFEISLMNIAKSGYFSSDRAVTEYMNNIWC